MNVKILNDKIAIVNAMYSSINDKDENYFTGTAMYLFRKIDNSWKIFSITPFKPYNYFFDTQFFIVNKRMKMKYDKLAVKVKDSNKNDAPLVAHESSIVPIQPDWMNLD